MWICRQDGEGTLGNVVLNMLALLHSEQQEYESKSARRSV